MTTANVKPKCRNTINMKKKKNNMTPKVTSSTIMHPTDSGE
jgi:hypothetical protein